MEKTFWLLLGVIVSVAFSLLLDYKFRKEYDVKLSSKAKKQTFNPSIFGYQEPNTTVKRKENPPTTIGKINKQELILTY